MLHTKFRENRPVGSGEEVFECFFTTYRRGGHLGHVIRIARSNFLLPMLKIWSDSVNSFSRY